MSDHVGDDDCPHELAEANERIAHLEVALTSSRHIGAAVGIVMAAHRVTEDQAFDAISVQSQHQNRKLRDIAEDIMLSGEVAG